MLKTAKHTLIAGLMLASLLAAPAASARILIDRQAPAAITQVVSAGAPQTGDAGASFAWGDAGIGAAAAFVLIGAISLTVSVRRRQHHHAAMG